MFIVNKCMLEFRKRLLRTLIKLHLLPPAKCIDHYTKLRVANAEDESLAKPIDARLEAIVNRMFQRCFDDRQFKQAVGIALETRRIDIFENAILQSVSSLSLIYFLGT